MCANVGQLIAERAGVETLERGGDAAGRAT